MFFLILFGTYFYTNSVYVKTKIIDGKEIVIEDQDDCIVLTY